MFVPLFALAADGAGDAGTEAVDNCDDEDDDEAATSDMNASKSLQPPELSNDEAAGFNTLGVAFTAGAAATEVAVVTGLAETTGLGAGAAEVADEEVIFALGLLAGIGDANAGFSIGANEAIMSSNESDADDDESLLTDENAVAKEDFLCPATGGEVRKVEAGEAGGLGAVAGVTVGKSTDAEEDFLPTVDGMEAAG